MVVFPRLLRLLSFSVLRQCSSVAHDLRPERWDAVTKSRTAPALAIAAGMICAFGLTGTASTVTAQGVKALPPRQMEDLGRGVVVIHQGGGKVFVSWRLLGPDPDDIAFNLYRV